MKSKHQEEDYWTQRYHEEKTGWDIGHPSMPLKAYSDQLENKEVSILIPGAGNAYEAEYLYQQGFHRVVIMDISEIPLRDFSSRNPEFPKSQIIHDNFFEHLGNYELILEQTFFCSFVPTKENRAAYAQKMNQLLVPNGKLVGLWFDMPLTEDMEKRPFGGTKNDYLHYLSPYFYTRTFEKAYNSIPPRQNREFFGIFQKK